ncbi:anhydro-N-acetylmuramic acid kinase [Alteromonas sp. ASW11-19]|uniref:Anhydro-N-acetylmuramic acid kinase n=1 Tax=Alteromonas salexigens TaxID=2982530 RepID=A0ABT2VQ77_9ALTE|nr:anhydro-N-acetylmuramic acid kinase [Alteromonas salexigens]MCU7555447.1 anhydro-N-acetylmuramic acid kinase [Alteromonas salexigens]
MAYYIGLMSGTSMDGVDAVLCDITGNEVITCDSVSLPYPVTLLTALHSLCRPGTEEINLMGSADRAVADTFAKAVNKLLAQTGLQPDAIKAIGSHGQTVRHHPKGVPVHQGAVPFGFTLQLGDPNSLAVLTGIDVIADFRRKDIALGGEGAPLVPAFHQAVFSRPLASRVVANIGGIANISILPPAGSPEPVEGFDTGPGNTLMDAWCLQHTGKAYDHDGQWAAAGTVNARLLGRLLKDPYFTRTAPKSTGREHFNLNWLNHLLAPLNLAPEDVQATLLALTTHTLSDAITQNSQAKDVLVCGGGAFNSTLMRALKERLPHYSLTTSDQAGIHPQQVEGAAFAWLAYAFLNRIPGNIPSVTGASRAAVLGTYCPV